VELNEIVVEGLKGYAQMTRVALAPGLTMGHPVDERVGVMLEVVLDLLFPKGGDLTLQHLVEPSAPQSRIGILVTGRNGTHYRVMKDVRSGRITMMKMTAQGGESLSSRAPEIAQMVTAQLGFPQEDVMRDLYFTRREDMPSQRPDALEISGLNAPPPPEPSAEPAAEEVSKPAWKKPLPPGFEEAASSAPSEDFGGLSKEQQQGKLSELKAQRAQIDKVKELEFELDGLQKKGFSLDERLRPLEHLQKQKADAQAMLERVARAGELPDDLSEQKRRYLQTKAAHEAELQEIDDEVTRIEEQLKRELARTADDKGVAAQAIRDPFVAYGGGAGLVALILGGVGFVAYEPLRWVALADIVAFGVAAFGAFRFIGDAEQAAILKGQIGRKGAERERLVKKFELEESAFKALLKRFGLSMEDVDQVDEEVRVFNEAKHALASADAAITEALDGGDLASITAEREALSEQIKEMEEKLYSAGGYMGNVDELDGQIKALEDLIAGVAPATPATPEEPVPEVAPTPSVGATEPSGPSAVAGQTAAHLQALVGQASDIFVSSLDVTCTQLAPRAGQYLTGMSDRRYAQMVFGPKGEVSVVDGATGRAIPFGMLTPSDRDIVYLCLKMTIIEQACRHMRLPVILDRAFETFPDVKHPLLVRMLQFLAQGTQVFVLTRQPTIAAAGGQPVAVLPPN
jgi:hypothetical protein